MATKFNESYVKELRIKNEGDIVTVLEFLDPEEEIKVVYTHNPESAYVVSFASEIMFVADVREYIPDAVITAVW